jgi:flagellar biosynthetic protein FliQ
MNSTDVLEVSKRAVEVVLLLSMPLLLTSLFVGVAVSLLQSVTQIQEQTLSFVPKLVAVLVVLLLCLPWALDVLGQFMSDLFLGFIKIKP